MQYLSRQISFTSCFDFTDVPIRGLFRLFATCWSGLGDCPLGEGQIITSHAVRVQRPSWSTTPGSAL